MTKHTKESLDSVTYPELKSIADSYEVEYKGNVAKYVLIDAILAAQGTDDVKEQPLQEQTKEEEVKEETKQAEESYERFMPEMDDSHIDHATPPAVKSPDSIAQLALAIQQISQNQSANHVSVTSPKFLREYDTEEGKKVYRELSRKATRMVHVRIHKNNSRMRGERYVQFDTGNAVFSIQWNVALGVDWYIPEILLDHINSRAYQKIDTSDSMHPTKLGSGNAETSQNFVPQIAREYSVEIIERTNKSVNQLLDELALKRRHGFVPSEQYHESFDGLKLD